MVARASWRASLHPATAQQELRPTVSGERFPNPGIYRAAPEANSGGADPMRTKSLKSCSERLFPSIERPVSGKSLPIDARQSSHPLAIELEQNDVFVWNPTGALRAIDSLLIAAKGYRL